MPSSKYFAIFETMWNSSSLEQETTKVTKQKCPQVQKQYGQLISTVEQRTPINAMKSVLPRVRIQVVAKISI